MPGSIERIIERYLTRGETIYFWEQEHAPGMDWRLSGSHQSPLLGWFRRCFISIYSGGLCWVSAPHLRLPQGCRGERRASLRTLDPAIMRVAKAVRGNMLFADRDYLWVLGAKKKKNARGWLLRAVYYVSFIKTRQWYMVSCFHSIVIGWLSFLFRKKELV